jgi:hypothetical protein
MATIVDQPTRVEIADRIAKLKAKHDRLPVHWTEKRGKIMAQIYDLIDEVNAL